MLVQSGYLHALRDGTDEGEDRFENLQELRGVLAQYTPGMADLTESQTPLAKCLEEISLVSDTDNLDDSRGAVTLLTLHMAKGLEFPVVFIVGLEEGILPHSRTPGNRGRTPEGGRLAEERRLLYVGITRAKRRLYLVHCFRRSLWGDSQPQAPSRFLDEIPEELLTGMVDRQGRRARQLPALTAWGDSEIQRAPRSQTAASGAGVPSRRRQRGERPAARQGPTSRAPTQPAAPSPRRPTGRRAATRTTASRRRQRLHLALNQLSSGATVSSTSFGVGTVIESVVGAGSAKRSPWPSLALASRN